MASIITNIQFDHEKWLGHTLAEIAGEKAGIIKRRVPVITATDRPEALNIIKETAQKQAAPLAVVSKSDLEMPPLSALEIPLLGEHQRFNAAVALATVRILNATFAVSEERISRGLSGVQWPGRLQLETTISGQRILLDGAHNPGGAQALRAAMQAHFPGMQPDLILGIMRDKDWPAICRILAPLADRIFLAPVASQRTALPAELKAICQTAHPQAEIIGCANLESAFSLAADASFVVITGSLHFVGEAMELLQIVPGKNPNERCLNEWQATP